MRHANSIFARLIAFALVLIAVALFWGSLLADQQEIATKRNETVNALLKEARR